MKLWKVFLKGPNGSIWEYCEAFNASHIYEIFSNKGLTVDFVRELKVVQKKSLAQLLQEV